MIKLAILDMNAGVKNLGMNSIQNIVSRYKDIDVDIFDIRGKLEIPSTEYDIYICSGGPGNPLEGDGVWDRGFYHLMNKLWLHNQRYTEKKYVFFICHSFQMICHHLSLLALVKRRKPSFGVFPIHLTEDGEDELIFDQLENPFYAADFRHYQLIQPNAERIEAMGCKILALEKERPHVDLERAVMAMRFSDEWLGVQFHPEADPEGMNQYFSKETKKKELIDQVGQDRFDQIIEATQDGTKLRLTYDTILPNFIDQAIYKIHSTHVVLA